MIQNNYICGSGYPGSDTNGLFAIDVTATNNPTVKNNTICGSATVAMAARLLTTQQAGPTKAAPIQ